MPKATSKFQIALDVTEVTGEFYIYENLAQASNPTFGELRVDLAVPPKVILLQIGGRTFAIDAQQFYLQLFTLAMRLAEGGCDE